MNSRLRIVVTGLAATYPFGGVFWDYFQYLLGLHRLGHDVLYIEDTGKWSYDPKAGTFVKDGANNAAFLAKEIAWLEPNLIDRWFYRDGCGKTYGRTWSEVVEFCRSADLFLHISASCWMRDEYFSAKRVVFIDSDPMYTQASVPHYLAGTLDTETRDRVDMLRRHHSFFTYGENVGAPGCRVPTGLFNWIPMHQPIVLDQFVTGAVEPKRRRRVLTTVASWEPAETGPVVEGVKYYGKSVEFERFLDLPSKSTLPIELAMSGRAPADRLVAHGWNMVDAYGASCDPRVYRDYLARSFGEWSVAKHTFVASRSGWFSSRTACYLALGVPAIVQDTGFSTAIPVGEGLLTFHSLEEAIDAIDQVVGDPERHSKGARAIAEEYFDSDKVLNRLLQLSFST